jgi:putative transposase
VPAPPGGPKTFTTRRDADARPAPDLVDRRFVAEHANQLWVADITYVPTWSGLLYLAVVLDVLSRRIVGWAMANHLRSELVLDALNMAVEQRRPAEVIHHSDQGCQYTSIAFGLPTQSGSRRATLYGQRERLLRQRNVCEFLRYAGMRAARA